MKRPEDFNAIAQRIKQRRMELNLGLQDVADMTDMSKSTLQRYESGSIRNIPLQKLGMLASALQTSADWILGWCKEPDDIPPSDAYFRNFIKALGYTIHAWPGYKSNIYLSSNEISPTQITKEEYERFRDSISAFVRFNANTLLQQAWEREQARLKEESTKMKKFIEILKADREEEGKSTPTEDLENI